MAIFSKLFNKTEQKSAPPTNNPVDIIEAILSGSTNGASAHSNAYRSNPVVRRAVDIRCMAVSSPTAVVTDLDGTPIPDHPLLRAFRKPNPNQNTAQFISAIEFQMALHGIAYIYVQKTGLYVIPAENVTPQQSTDWFNPVAYYSVNLTNETRRVLPSDMLVIHGNLKEDGYTPISPLDSCMDAITTFREAQDWNRSLLVNGGKPMTIVTIPDKLTAQSYQEFANRYRATMQGSGNAGSTAILDGGKTLQSVGMSAVDLDYTNGVNQLTMLICMALGVSPEVIGSQVNACYNTVSESTRNFSTKTVLPELDLIYDALTSYYQKTFPDNILTYDRETVDGLHETPSMVDVQNLTYLTTNEKRAMFSYDPVPDGDKVLVTAGLIPIEDLSIDMDESDTTDPFGDN